MIYRTSPNLNLLDHLFSSSKSSKNPNLYQISVVIPVVYYDRTFLTPQDELQSQFRNHNKKIIGAGLYTKPEDK